MANRLEEYVKSALTTNTDRVEIISRAKAAGWDEGEINSALAAWSEHPDTTGNPIPVNRPSALSEVFFYLLRFTAFYVSLWGVIDLAFAVINHLVPAPGSYLGGYAYETRHSVAALTVSLPLYIMMLLKNSRLLTKDPARYESGVRKTFIYSVLFASAATAMGCAISLVYGVLAHAGNVNSGVKLAALIVLSAILFFDYRAALKAPASGSHAKGGVLWLALLAVVGLYVSGLAFALQNRELPRDQPSEPAPAKPVTP